MVVGVINNGRAGMKSRCYKFFYVVIACIMCSCDIVDSNTPRSIVSGIVVDTRELRFEISNYVSNKNSAVNLGGGVPTVHQELSKKYDLIKITSTEDIIVYNEKFSVLVVMEPIHIDGKIKWKCDAWPHSTRSVVCNSGVMQDN